MVTRSFAAANESVAADRCSRRQTIFHGPYCWGIEEAEFESLLDQVREPHRRTDEITRSKTRLHEHIRAQLRWERTPPTIPQEQRELAEEVVEALTKRRLSSGRSRRLFETYFGRR